MSNQVKFLSGLRSSFLAKFNDGTLTPGALYFCTDEKKIYKAITNNTYEAVNEEVFVVSSLPNPADAFFGKLYLKQPEMTLHVVVVKDDIKSFKQLSAPADALVPNDVSEDLNAEDGKKLASKAAVKAGIKAVDTKLDNEITQRALDEAQLLKDAKKYADDQDVKLAGNYNTAGEGQTNNASGLRGEIESKIKAEKDRAELAEKGLSDKIDIINGEGKGSIKKAVADEKAERVAKDNELAQDIADEASARTEADSLLEARIAKFEEGGANSVAAQIKGVQDQVDSIKNIVGHEAIPGGEGKDPQPAEGLFAKLDEEKTRAEAAEKVLTNNLAAEVTRATAADEANAAAIAAEKTRAEDIEAGLRTDVNSKVDQSAYNTKIAALEKADTDNLAAAKAHAEKYTDDLIGNFSGVDEQDNPIEAKGLSKEIEERIAAEAKLRSDADKGLQGAIDDINAALGLGEGATVGVGTRLNNLEAAVGTKKEGEKEATGLYKEVEDLKGADTALDGRLDYLESVVEDENSGLVKKVTANTAAIATINGSEDVDGSIAKALKNANTYTDTAVANLVNSAPEALDTLQELANALGDDPNFATTVATNIGKKADTTYVDEKLAEIKTGEGSIGARLTAVEEKNTEQDTAIANAQAKADQGVADAAAEATRAQAAELGLQNSINAINNETTGILAQAKAHAIEKDGELHTAITSEINTAVKAEEDRAVGVETKLREDVDKKVAKTDYDAKVAELEQADTANLEAAKTDATNKDNALRTELQEYANSAVEVEKNRAEAEEGKLTTAVNSKVDQSAYDTKIAALEKADTDNLAAAKSYTDEKVKEVSDKVGDLNDLETTEHGSAVLAINELKGAVDKINADLGLEGATGTTGGIKDRLDSLEGVVGNSEKGLVKDVAENTTAIAKNAGDIAKNTTNISNNAAAIAIINGSDTQEGSIAKALKDANAYTDGKIGKPSVPGEGEAQGTPAEGLYAVIEAGDADALADAKEYADTEIGKAVGEASKPGEADKPGTPATGLHKVIEDGDATTLESAKNYADTTVTEALTWGSF